MRIEIGIGYKIHVWNTIALQRDDENCDTGSAVNLPQRSKSKRREPVCPINPGNTSGEKSHLMDPA
jgi:hypothetical protein